ncbi:MAG: hypothetical protein WBC91_14795 [Phototrophicaceae bacterium]
MTEVKDTIKSNLPISNYVAVPRLAIKELDAFETKVLIHYIEGCYIGRGKFQQGVRATAEACKMSQTKVIKCRHSLVEKGYIELREGKFSSEATTIIIDANNMWWRNHIEYQDEDQRVDSLVNALKSMLEMGDIDEIAERLALQIWDSTALNMEKVAPNMGQYRTKYGAVSKSTAFKSIIYSLRDVILDNQGQEQPQEPADDDAQIDDDSDNSDDYNNPEYDDEPPEPKKQTRKSPNPIKDGQTGEYMHGIYQGDSVAEGISSEVSPLELAILAQFPTFVITDTHRKKLGKSVVVKMDNHEEKHHSANELFKTNVMFKRFIEQRLKMYVAMKNKPKGFKVDLHSIVGNIVNYSKVSEKNANWNGWLDWRAKQQVILDAAQALKQPKEIWTDAGVVPPNPWEIPGFMDNAK